MIQRREKRLKIEVSSYKGKRFTGWARVLIILALTGVLSFAVLLGQVMSGARDNISGEPQVMVVLGCQLHSWGPSVMLQDRLDKALDYLADHPDMTVVLSGGQGPEEPAPEAQGTY